jgi:hypothetical protein
MNNDTNNFNDFKHDDILTNLLQQYMYIIDAKQNKIDVKSYITLIEKYFGSKVSCNSCPSSLKKAQSDFERVIFTNLYRQFPYMLYKPDKNLLTETRFVNGMYENIVTSSFSLFGDFLQSFENDFVSKRLKIDRTKYNIVCDELIKFNTDRFRYFDDIEDSIYNRYIKAKSLYSTVNVIEEAKPIKKVKNFEISENFDINVKTKINLLEAIELKKQGKSNEEIGAVFGVTKQYVGQFLKKNLINEK